MYKLHSCNKHELDVQNKVARGDKFIWSPQKRVFLYLFQILVAHWFVVDSLKSLTIFTFLLSVSFFPLYALSYIRITVNLNQSLDKFPHLHICYICTDITFKEANVHKYRKKARILTTFSETQQYVMIFLRNIYV